MLQTKSGKSLPTKTTSHEKTLKSVSPTMLPFTQVILIMLTSTLSTMPLRKAYSDSDGDAKQPQEIPTAPGSTVQKEIS